MNKKMLLSCLFAILVSVSFTYAKGTDETSSTGVKTIKFYGSGAQYNLDIVAKFEAKFPNIKVEIVPVDFVNAEQVIKTGIASGNPVDVSFFWGSQVSTFVNNDMALDLTPYLMANGKEWYKTFVPKYIDAGLINGKYYAISYQPVFETFFVNKDLFKQNNLEIPKTWDDLLKVSAALKEKGLYAIGCFNGYHHQMLPFAYQIYANNGVLNDAAAGKLPFAGPKETPGLRQNLEMIRDIYKKGYWYPGEGALTATQEQVQAAFYQGKIAMLFDAGSNAGKYEKEAPFAVGAMKFPLVKAGGKYGVNVITNALFVPANATNKKEAVEFMKFYTNPVGQEITLGSGRPPSTIVMQDKVTNALIKEIYNTTTGDNAVGYRHIQNISSQVGSYLGTMVSAVCSGESIDSVLEKLEKLRLEAVKK